LHKDNNLQYVSVVITGDIFKLYFDQSVDLGLIKVNLLNKLNKYKDEAVKLSQRLTNKDFVNKAPKNIVEQEKINYNNLKNDFKKISLIIESL